MLFAFPFPNLLLDIKLEFSNTHMYLFSAYSMLLSYYSGKEKRLWMYAYLNSMTYGSWMASETY